MENNNNNSNRFSIMLLEKDVLEYHNFKNKYNEFDQKCANCSFEEKEDLEKKKKYWYKRYMGRMKYLEENYRKTNVYTRYHAQLENPTHSAPTSIPMAFAEPVIHNHVMTEELCVLPCAPTHDPTLPSAPPMHDEQGKWRQRL